ncbi:MAG: TcdA/TcdB catalytic glycosyltransferase domain-containing protein [Myxococcota bacterium]|nr:TcdA/TcdB catalytic glycosyltransferase domain-containing protein [Myxococcota bacterium]
MLQWKTLNPSWSVCLWANPEDLSFSDWTLLNKWATQNGIALRSVAPYWDDPELGGSLCDVHHAGRYASASDILRVLILNSEGGLYVDTDVLPIKLAAQSIPRGVGLVIKFDDDTLRSVLPYAMCMTPSHPFGLLLIEQLNFNLLFFKQSDLSWMQRPSRKYQYAATVGVTGTAWTLLMLRLKDEELTRSRLLPFQLPFALHHQEHNSWLPADVSPKKTWRPLDYLASQKDWALRQSKVDLHHLDVQYANCIIGE